MPYYANPAVLEYGLSYIKNSTTQIALLREYETGDTYATCYSNRVAAYSSGPGDFVIEAQGDHARVRTSNHEVTSFFATDVEYLLHIAFLDTDTGTVVAVMESAVNEPVLSGVLVSIPPVFYTARQPVADI